MTACIAFRPYSDSVQVSADDLRVAREADGGSLLGAVTGLMMLEAHYAANESERRMFADMEARASAHERYERDLAEYRGRSRSIFDAWERRIARGYQMTALDVARIQAELDAIRPVPPPKDPVEQLVEAMAPGSRSTARTALTFPLRAERLSR